VVLIWKVKTFLRAGQEALLKINDPLGRIHSISGEKDLVTRLLSEDAEFSGVFVAYLLARSIRIQEDLVDQLFNSTEKRLARMLLLLAGFGKERSPEPVVPRITQEALAEMIGTTRARVSGFMNKFRKLGLIDYNGGLHVQEALMNVVLHD
jgi:CRP/FNR family cyclic AMP-dependent transcriptional regulator